MEMVIKMKIFKHITNLEEFEDFKQKQTDDDKKIKLFFENHCDHKQFLSSLMHLGTLIDIITTYLDFLKPQIDKALTFDDPKRDRKLNKYMKDLNERINMEYGFYKDIVIVEQCILFEGELYLFFNKSRFIKLFGLTEL